MKRDVRSLLVKARVHVMLKPGVHDPQGKAVANALAALGFDGIDELRQGKYIEIDLAESDRSLAESKVELMCSKLLANPVIENYSIAIED